MAKKRPTFDVRAELLAKAAEDLRVIAGIVADEAAHMAEARQRFAGKRAEKRPGRA
ncbi:MAG: hypothetical protein AB7F99_00670 [Vicinamibacterales bacterium]